MFYIFNKVIPSSKKIEFSLKVIYGINNYQSQKICKIFGINPKINIIKIKKNQLNNLINYLNKNKKVEYFLKKEKKENFLKLLDIKLIRSLRYNQGLPVRGQRTHTNAQTVKRLKKKLKKNKKNKKKKKKNDY